MTALQLPSRTHGHVLRVCGLCGRPDNEAALEEACHGTDWVCVDGATCLPHHGPRQRHHADLTPDVLDRLELEGEKEDWDCEMYGAREVSGPELLALVALARKVHP